MLFLSQRCSYSYWDDFFLKSGNKKSGGILAIVPIIFGDLKNAILGLSGRLKKEKCSKFLATRMTEFFKKLGGKSRVDFRQSYLICFGPKKRNIRSCGTFKKEKCSEFHGESTSHKSS